RNWKVKKPKALTYSILIACRNEEKNLPKLFESLKKLDYLKEKFEIIIVDDVSTDNSLELIKEFCKININAKYFHLSEKHSDYKGKKAALKLASENAKYDILIFTDSDCSVHPEWLKSYNNYFADNIGMVVGNYFEIKTNPLRIFSNQMSSGIYASTIGLGIPFSAAGGNLAVKKTAFDEIGGYEKIKRYQSGDDKLLLKLIHKAGWKIAYNHEQLVDTYQVKDNKTLNHQLKRRYGKFGMSSTFFKIISILIFLFYLYLPIKSIFFYDWKSLIIYFLCILFFWIVNLVKHKYRFRILDIPLLIIYPYFLIYFSLLGTFGKWEWKSS
ncbi:MAG: glycosyltransferase, partial [Candidatus Cloacimonetes bacterium]|nr:glycosyltransferase [Candidatus Cloacimonadota bacterium]